MIIKKILTEHKVYKAYKALSNLFINYFRYGIIGSNIRMEASMACQLKCVVCPRTRGLLELLGNGYMKFEDFKKFIDKYPTFKNIELSNFGEMFLNPELNDIIKYVYQKNIRLTANNGVNLNTVNEETIKYLVRYKFKSLTISIDGASNDTYKIYRVGGDFNRVIENIKKINYYKKQYNSQFPTLQWQFIIFGHNEHELLLAKKMAKKLNMAFVTKLNFNSAYSPVKNEESVRKIIGYAYWEEFEQKYKKPYLPYCLQLWRSPQINWDGKLLGCCGNRWDDFGNVFDSGLEKCLKSEKYIYAKEMLLGLKEAREDIPCFYCRFYIDSKFMKDALNSSLQFNFIKLLKDAF